MPSSSSHQETETYSTVQQEEFSYAFISTIVAAAGYAMPPPTRSLDNAGIDVIVTAPGEVGTALSPRFDAQVKCTSISSYIKKKHFNYPLAVHNYTRLIHPNPCATQLLIVVYIPKDLTRWTDMTEDGNILRHCAYWISLKGKASTTNKETVTIPIPRENLLTPQSLQAIMQRIADKEL
jgi:hypothetical protein